MSFEDFLAWAKIRENIPNDTEPYLKECFDYALAQTQIISYLLAPFQQRAYAYCLALHLIILTPNQANNELHLKYFPKDTNGANANLLSVIESVSNATSSVSNIAYKGLQDLNLKNAMLTSTPYGCEVASMNEALEIGIVVV